ncbi:MAG: bifunctional folylpolyglutamate synthase/dihydrofolate synthase [Alphaproteobacteria bacterium]|nr:bifunctional folylpolyglutamate synthase/dihydrofolate synthase [Alphaproteobacteria bacterium]
MLADIGETNSSFLAAGGAVNRWPVISKGYAVAAVSQDILERFRTQYGKDIDLTLRPAYRDLLAAMGNPQDKIPPVFHVAGTNGKGSTCAFLRAILEAAGYRVHVYTSPHLVRFHERIRVAGALIEESELAAILAQCEAVAAPGKVSYFEAATAAAFVAFARHPADFTILETGLGGRLDATNIVEKPLATIITRLSYDHRDYLGDSIAQIAREKAGIMRAGVPCFTAPQPEVEALATLRAAAAEKGAALHVGGGDWRVEETADGFTFADAARRYDLPKPGLVGRHQVWNAGLAIAALAALPRPLPADAVAQGVRRVEWPARMQRLTAGFLPALLPPGAELWLDGGHNDSAGEVVAAQIAQWRREDGDAPRPLYIVTGMLTTKRPAEFIGPFAHAVTRARTVVIEDEPLSFGADALAGEMRALGIDDVAAAAGIADAVQDLAGATTTPAPRLLICGSLYLAGRVLAIG